MVASAILEMIWPNSNRETRRKAGLKPKPTDQGEMFPEVKSRRGFNNPKIAAGLKLIRQTIEIQKP